MTHSESLNELAAALAKAQGDIAGAIKDSKNPHFNSKYADLASIVDACRKPLAANGLAVLQSPHADANLVRMTTLLIHASGQWIESDVLQVQARDAGPQGVGSCLTYLRRYQLAALIGIAPEDDDAEAAEGRSAKPISATAVPKGTPITNKPGDKRTWSPAPPTTSKPIQNTTVSDDVPPLTDADIPFKAF